MKRKEEIELNTSSQALFGYQASQNAIEPRKKPLGAEPNKSKPIQITTGIKQLQKGNYKEDEVNSQAQKLASEIQQEYWPG